MLWQPLWTQTLELSSTQTEGMYANFAGRDASRGMAKQSFDEGMDARLTSSCLIHDPLPEMLTPIDQPMDKLEDLTAEEMYVHRTHSLGVYRHIH